jgi:hypothetical protein
MAFSTSEDHLPIEAAGGETFTVGLTDKQPECP